MAHISNVVGRCSDCGCYNHLKCVPASCSHLKVGVENVTCGKFICQDTCGWYCMDCEIKTRMVNNNGWTDEIHCLRCGQYLGQPQWFGPEPTQFAMEHNMDPDWLVWTYSLSAGEFRLIHQLLAHNKGFDQQASF